MRSRIPTLWLVFLGLLLLYAWTWNETADVTLQVTGGVCSAELYGRASALPCPGLAGGTLATYSGRTQEPIPRGHGPLDRLTPGSDWVSLEIVDAGGKKIAGSDPLPETFEVRGRLRRPNEPAGLILLRPGSDSGWAFVPEGQTRRGIWWSWANNELGTPLQGVPFDKPLVAQFQSTTRLFLDGWQGALILVVLAWGIAKLFKQIATRSFRAPLQIHNRILILPAILFAFAMTLHVSVDVIQRIPHVQDSVTYLFQAQTLARGHLTAPAPPLAGPDETPHFRQEFILVRDGRWFGKYTPGYPAVLAGGVLLGTPWIVNPLLAALIIPLVHTLAKTLYRPRRDIIRANAMPARAGVAQPGDNERRATPNMGPFGAANLSPFLLALSPFFLIMSGSLMAHTAELFWTTLFMIAWVMALKERQPRWAVVAGIALGALFLTRQFTALTVGLSFGGGWLFMAVVERDLRGSHRIPSTKNQPMSVTTPLLLALLAAAPFFLAVFVYQAAVTGDPLTDPRLLYWPYDRVGFGPGIGESQNSFTFVQSSAGSAQQWSKDPAQPPRGNTPSLGLYNLGRNLSALQSDLFGWPPLFSLAFIWLAFLLRRPTAADWVLLLVAIAIGGGYIAYWAAGIAFGPRYFFAALPALVILTARGILALDGRAGRIPTLTILLALVAYSFLTLPERLESYRGYNFVDAEPQQSVAAAVTKPALVFVTASDSDWWEYGAFFSGNTPWLDSDILYARDLGAAENSRLWGEFPDRVAYLWREGQLQPFAP